MSKADKFPRLLNLVMLLLDAKVPLSLDAIARRIGGFPDAPSARRQAFERAKKELRDLGIPLSTRQIPGSDQYGYLIEKSEMVIEDLRFTPSEASALAVASAIVRFGEGERDSALAKLGCVIADEEATVAAVPNQPALFPLFEAVAMQKAVRFTYRGKSRTLDVYGIIFKWGNWYVVGFERESKTSKTFLVLLVQSEVQIIDSDRAPKPSNFDISSQLPRNRWEIGEGHIDRAVLVVSAEISSIVCYELGDEVEFDFDDDGSATFTVPVADTGSFFEWLLGYFDKIILTAPNALVNKFKSHLAAIATDGYSDSELDLLLARVDALLHRYDESRDAQDDIVRGARVETASEDLRSAAAMYGAISRILPWLAARRRTTVEEISKSFDLSNIQVVRLLEAAACCGLPPYTPDALLEIIIDDDGAVTSFLDMDLITAPRSLDTLEAMVLATTASVALAVPGIDPEGHLQSASDKLQESLKKFRLGRTDLAIEMEEPFFLSDLRSAANSHHTVDLTYFSFSSERLTKRNVDPYLIFSEAGKWYLRGYCHLTHEIRHFSLGRIISCEITGIKFRVDPDETAGSSRIHTPAAYEGAGELVIVGVDRSVEWLVDRNVSGPNRLGESGNLVIFSMRFSSEVWLSKLLLQLGPSAEIILPLEMRDLKAKTARKLLAKYDAGLDTESMNS